MQDVTQILKRYERSKQGRDCLAHLWREASDYVRPVKQDIAIESGESTGPNESRLNAIFDTTAIDANRTYAAGCMSWMTPSETTWFGYDPPEYLAEDDTVKSWYSRCTDITRQIMAASNFYSAIHECYLDDGAFGTSGLLIEEDPRNGLRFEALQIGKYTILENDKREVDTLFREVKLTPRQAEQRFGRDKLHSEVKKVLENNDKACDQAADYIHAIMPRADAERSIGKLDSVNMPWASIYIDRKNKHIVSESGSWEMPAAVHRHLLWSQLEYGFSPAMQALPDCRQLNFMQSYLDTLVEKQVTPPVLLPSAFEGRVDLRAGGHTFFKDSGAMPQFWQNPGNYTIGEDRTLFRSRQINRAFHVELFQALGEVPVGKEMTAAEIHMRQRDRLTLFSPTFARKNTELNTPIMRRVFAILLRAGAFPQIPNNLVSQGPDGLPYLPDPEITYTSRLALQMKAIHNESFMRLVDTVGPMAAQMPNMLDHIDGDAVTRGIARNEGVPESWLRTESDVMLMREARAEQQAQMQAEQSAIEEAGAVAKLGQAGVIAA